jgi:hypothetical protein
VVVVVVVVLVLVLEELGAAQPVALRRGARPAVLPRGPVAQLDRQMQAHRVQVRPVSAAHRTARRMPEGSTIPATILVVRAIPQKHRQLRARIA